MYGLTAFNPTAAALRRSSQYGSLEQAQAQRETIRRLSRELVDCYQGNQAYRVLAWLANHLRDPRIRSKYIELALFWNMIRLVVDRSTTLGQHPIRIVWVDENGQQSTPDQDLWEHICESWMGDDGWDQFIGSIGKQTQLLKTIVAEPEWDDHNEVIQLNAFGPHEIDVDYEEGNLNKQMPDRFTFLREEASGIVETWDFSSRAKGASGIRKDDAGKIISDLPVIDPLTGRSAVSFVAFRTARGSDYFLTDGQEEALKAQDLVNRIYSRISVLVELGINKTMILSGGGWTDEEGNLVTFPFDLSTVWKEPEDGFDASNVKQKIRWDGPDVVKEIGAAVGLAIHWTEQILASNRVNPSTVRSSNDGQSGYSLNIDYASLREKHREDATRLRKPIQRLARLVALTWNQFNPIGRKFGQGVSPRAIIPDWTGAAVTKDESDSDLALIAAGVKRVLPSIYKYEPGISPKDAEAQALKWEEMSKFRTISTSGHPVLVPDYSPDPVPAAVGSDLVPPAAPGADSAAPAASAEV